MSPSTIIEEREISKLGKHSHIKAMGICRLNIPLARRDFTATLAAPLPYYATLVVLFSRTVAVFFFSQEPYS
jgi:hypothetical protein